MKMVSSKGAQAQAIVADMSTISPTATRQLAETLAQKGIKMIDAPVSGGSEGAQKGTLSIMIGGAEEDLEKVRPVLEAMGTTITHVGPIGAGQLTKAINQIIVAGTYWSVAEGLVTGDQGRSGYGQSGSGCRRGGGRIMGLDQPLRQHDRQRLPPGFSGQTAPQGSQYCAECGP